MQWTQVEDVVQMLTQLGLARDEALVFTTLSFLGPSRAGAVAGASKLSRAQTYRALELLGERGVVRSDLGRPRLYTAAPAESLLTHLRGDLETRGQELRLLEPDLARALAVAPRGTRTATSRTDILRGRKVVAARVTELYQAAAKQIDVVFTHPGGLPLMQALGHWDQVLGAARRGAHVRLLLAPRPDHQPYYDAAQASGHIEIRERTKGDLLAAVVGDWQESLVVLVADPSSYPRSDRTVALTSDAPNLVQLLAASFDALWTLAQAVGPPAAKPEGQAAHATSPDHEG